MKKKPSKKSVKDPSEKVEETALVKVESEKDGAWEWTPEREQLLEMKLAGASDVYCAREIVSKRGGLQTKGHISRTTVHAWKNHPEFKRRFREELAARITDTVQRRHHDTSVFTDKVSTLADRVIDKALKASQPTAYHVSQIDRLTSVISRLRNEERLDLGIATGKVDHRVGIIGQINHTHGDDSAPHKAILETPLRGFIEAHKAIIDVEQLDNNPEFAIGDAMIQLISKTEIVDAQRIAETEEANEDG